MKQLLKNVSNGETIVADVPAPKAGHGEVLVRVHASLISAGTEKTAIDFAESNLIQKAMSRPDLVRQAMDKARREGVLSTLDTVRNRLDSDLALGYSNAGTVIAVGNNITEFKVGDRVACAGAGYASHAEIVRVPRNLVALIPQGPRELSFEEAAFTTVGAIAVQGFRLAEPQLGETIVVIGLGLIGLVLVQIVKAAGCDVIGMDVNAERCRLAEELGCRATAQTQEQLQSLVVASTGAHGADSVIITAATKSSGPVALAGEIARPRGHVVVVGAVGLELPRKPYYDKELVFRVSCSYGPGRYDPEYEEKGHDYPIGFARWTENRNMQSVLRLIADGQLNVQRLITHRFPIEHASKGYELISGKTGEPFLGVVIEYPSEPDTARRIDLVPSRAAVRPDRISAGVIGAGAFATGVLLPAMKKVPSINLVGICTGSGATARGVGSRLGFRYCTTEQNELLQDPAINTIVIATRHHMHARQVEAALQAGKHVFCEKPLCINTEELAQLMRVYAAIPDDHRPLLMVGFNRRFSPLGIEMEKNIRHMQEPVMINYRVNAGFIPPSHWTQDPEQGAGRVIGEVCHFVDFCTFLAGSLVSSVYAFALPNGGHYRDDNLSLTLSYENGSVANITYVANGDKAFPKERVEVFGGGAVLVLDDYRSLDIVKSGRKSVTRSRLRQDKGHLGEWQAFAEALEDGRPSPISFTRIVNTTLVTFKALESCASQQPMKIQP
jgi:predicted dehydrogenase/threonine dehydrogenase-like Zn-dependent dehydrogenase